MKTPAIELLPIDLLKPWERNARTHSRKQKRQIADSIERYGFTNPILIDENRRILAGHGRVEAAKLLGMTEIPCVQIGHLTMEQKRAYVIADNKIALNAGWDEDLLALELKELLETDASFKVEWTGFSIPEADLLIEGLATEEPSDPRAERLPEDSEVKARCHPGDLWRLGPHRLICGDALDRQVVDVLMEGEFAEMAFTDPPYNVPIAGNVSGLGKVKHPEFAMASGEMTSAEFTAFLTKACLHLADYSLDGSIHYVCIDWRHLTEMQEAGRSAYTELKNLIVWVKDNGGMGTFYRSRHELIFAFKKGDAPHLNNFELGQHGRNRTNVWQYRGVNTLKVGRLDELALHPTVKPVQMIVDAIKDVSRRNGIVLDLFGGSGSTLIAAHKTARRARICEIDPVYCDRMIARWERFAKDEAERIACGIGADSAQPSPPSRAA